MVGFGCTQSQSGLSSADAKVNIVVKNRSGLVVTAQNLGLLLIKNGQQIEVCLQLPVKHRTKCHYGKFASAELIPVWPRLACNILPTTHEYYSWAQYFLQTMYSMVYLFVKGFVDRRNKGHVQMVCVCVCIEGICQ